VTGAVLAAEGFTVGAVVATGASVRLGESWPPLCTIAPMAMAARTKSAAATIQIFFLENGPED